MSHSALLVPCPAPLAAPGVPQLLFQGQRISAKLLSISSPSLQFFLFLDHSWFSVLCVQCDCCGLTGHWGAAEGGKVHTSSALLWLWLRDDVMILFHLLPSIFEFTGKHPSCETRESLISSPIPGLEVPLECCGWHSSRADGLEGLPMQCKAMGSK